MNMIKPKIGGLKAVLWTDLFQFLLMAASVLVVLWAGIVDSGGISNVFNRSWESGRLTFFEMSLDPTKRYTFWNTFVGGLAFGFCGYGTTQTEVQRLLSMKNLKMAKSTLIMSILPSFLMYFFTSLCGVVIFSVFYGCDPVLSNEHTGVEKYDQITPYYIVRRFWIYPGLTGLYIAGVLSSCLSTVSSVLNSMSTVTVMDFIKPIKPCLSETKTVVIAKGLSVLYGAFCIVFAIVLSKTDSVVGTIVSLNSVTQYPVAAVFALAVLTQKLPNKCVLFGLISAMILQSWMVYGILFSGYVEPPLPFSTSLCGNSSEMFQEPSESTANITYNAFSPIVTKTNIFGLYKVSYLWMPFTGFTFTIILTFVAYFLTGCKSDSKAADSRLQSPVTKLWKKELKEDGIKDKQVIPLSFKETFID